MKLLFVSLGCDKNLVDSEVMLGNLNKRGFKFTDEDDEADVIIINTCCFINDAKEESINTILEMAEYRKSGNCKALIVTGCLAERYKQEIIDEIPEVDAILGTTSFDHICEAVDKALEGEHMMQFDDLGKLVKSENKRAMTIGRHYAHLKIAEGCDKHCTYCVIPSVRGSYRSVPMEELLEEAKYLAEQGIKELILVAQETTCYGVDLYGEKSLHKLLKELCKIDGLHWIRIMYCYPEEIYDELIQTIAEEPKICHYLDLPIQHCSNRILKLMGRKTTREQLEEKIQQLRDEIPDIVLRTTLIEGFPGETEDDHEELIEFIDQMDFERLGCFVYSQEEGTPAATFKNQIPEKKKKKWRDEIMEVQQFLYSDTADIFLGDVFEVMIEGLLEDGKTYVGRTYKDAPDVDGYVFVKTKQKLMSGDFVKVKLTDVKGYDYIGKTV